MKCLVGFLLGSMALSGCGENRFQTAGEEAMQQMDRPDQERLGPVRDSLMIFLGGSLGVPQVTLDRMLVNLGENCALLVDPGDPDGCLGKDGLRFGDCRATLAVRTEGQWALEGMGTFGTISFPDQCHMGIAFDGEFRHLGTLLKWAGP
jgi:hypothetical protein